MNLSYLGPQGYEEGSESSCSEDNLDSPNQPNLCIAAVDHLETEQHNPVEKDYGSPLLREKRQIVTQMRENDTTNRLFGQQINKLQKQIQNKSQELLSGIMNSAPRNKHK